jgi:transcriptional regulator with XRE-family HTH domain
MAKIRSSHLGDQLGSLGEFIANQRRAAELTLRQLAEQTGVSNPYLSQIERGLRKPSAEVLQQLAKALRVSAETLYVRAGILDPQDHPTTTIELALLSDPSITERQRRVLIDVYTSFVKENSQRDQSTTTEGPRDGQADDAPQDVTTPKTRPARKRANPKRPTAQTDKTHGIK